MNSIAPSRCPRPAVRALRAIVATAACAFASAALAQSYPGKAIRLIVPFPAGGPADVVARVIAGPLGQGLGQSVVVENRPGAGTAIGAEATARALPDGYTIMLGSVSSHAMLPALNPKVAYKPIADFTPIGPVASIPFVIVAHPSLNVSSVAELVALARAKPGALTAGSSGSGTSNHLAIELFKRRMSVEIVHVPYRGAAPALNDTLAGQISMMWDGVATATPHIRSGALRALAVTGRTRVPGLPEVPTAIEAGVRDYEVTAWFGLFGPARVPADAVARLNAEINKVLATPEVRERLTAQGTQVLTSSPDAFATFVRTESERWSEVVRTAQIRMD